VLARCAPARGSRGDAPPRLEQLSVQARGVGSDGRRGEHARASEASRLIVLLTDLDDANVADQLSRAVAADPPHLLV